MRRDVESLNLGVEGEGDEMHLLKQSKKVRVLVLRERIKGYVMFLLGALFMLLFTIVADTWPMFYWRIYFAHEPGLTVLNSFSFQDETAP